jgi:RNA polymerase sigma-70 factor (ECF subfamily)
MEQGTSCERLALDFRGGSPASSQLVLAAQRGDRATFLKLIHTYDAMVMRVAVTLAASEPAAQEIYCRVFREAFSSTDALGASSSVFIWLYRILVRHCLEYCRRNSDARLSAVDDDPVPTMARALLVLSPIERMVFQLKQFQGLKIRTLSEIFDAPPEFIATTLQNAISHLRIRLKMAPLTITRLCMK